MCGIAGILRVTPPGAVHEPIPESWLELLDAAVAHRGPDGAGRFRDSVVRPDGTRVEVALVHRRLSIIDHAGGAQPMVSERGKDLGGGRHEGLVAVVFNGCLYDHRERRARLERAGRVFVTDHSDTEVLIHGWREWARAPGAGEAKGRGERVREHLSGMYAVALWDRDDADLWLVRDDFGEKPLYVRPLDPRGSLVFASTAGVLSSAAFGPSPRVDPASMADWFALGGHRRWTPWRDISQIDAGASAWGRGTETGEGRARWGINGASRVAGSVESRPRGVTRSGVLGTLEARLRGAVASRLEADAPLGCFLSGGIDSSLIAHYAKRARPDLTTLCMRMPDPRYDESAHAAAVARHLGTNHITLDVQPSAADDLVHLITRLGLPFADSSLLPTYWLCKAAREHVKVALSGDGGDELFMGYQRHAAAKWLPLLRLAAWAWPTSGYDERDPTSRGARMARLIRAARGKGYTDLVAIFPSELRRRVFRAGGVECERPRFLGRGQARRFDLAHYLPGDLLRKTDAASMSVGLEVRCPFLDREVAALALGTPIRVLMRGNRPKALLRELAARHLPQGIVERPKQGFAIPVSDWFRSDFGGLRTLLNDILHAPDPFGQAGAALDIHVPAVNDMVEEHMKGRRDHGQRLYALTVLGVWARAFAR